jgi:hypothetical protein
VALFRAQILLECDQHDRLEELARQSGRSISDLVREATAEYLSRTDREEGLRRSLQALDMLTAVRQKIREFSGTAGIGLLEELREERDAEILEERRGELEG